jgi:hypothetical protein
MRCPRHDAKEYPLTRHSCSRSTNFSLEKLGVEVLVGIDDEEVLGRLLFAPFKSLLDLTDSLPNLDMGTPGETFGGVGNVEIVNLWEKALIGEKGLDVGCGGIRGSESRAVVF